MQAQQLVGRAPAREAEELGQVAERGARRGRARRAAPAPRRGRRWAGPGRRRSWSASTCRRRWARAGRPARPPPTSRSTPGQRLLARRSACAVRGRRGPARPSGRAPRSSGRAAAPARPSGRPGASRARPARAPSSAERREQRLARLRQVGDEQQRRHPQALDQVVEDFVEALGVGLVLGQHPRLGLLDVAVEAPDQGPGLLQRLGQLGPVEQLAEARRRRLRSPRRGPRRPAATGTVPSR